MFELISFSETGWGGALLRGLWMTLQISAGAFVLGLAIGLALVQFWPDFIWVGVIAGIFFLGQFIEGNVLSPKLVGEAVGLHPVWLMFALVAFGSLFGFLGLLLIFNNIAGWIFTYTLQPFPTPFGSGAPILGGILSRHELGSTAVTLLVLLGVGLHRL